MGMPKTIKRSDKHAQDIYEKTLENAEKEYGSKGGTAHKVAYASLKHEYKKQGDKWVRKGKK